MIGHELEGIFHDNPVGFLKMVAMRVSGHLLQVLEQLGVVASRDLLVVPCLLQRRLRLVAERLPRLGPNLPQEARWSANWPASVTQASRHDSAQPTITRRRWLAIHVLSEPITLVTVKPLWKAATACPASWKRAPRMQLAQSKRFTAQSVVALY